MSEFDRVLVVMAHPDDIDFWGVGTVMQWVRSGVAVTYALVTRGDAGGFGEEARDRIGQTRQQEQLEAARLAGVSDVRFLDGYQDGKVQVSDDLVGDITSLIREVKPDRVLTQSPDRNWYDVRLSHPDHLAVGEAVARAVYPFARNPFAFPELAKQGLEPWVVSELWFLGDPAPNQVVDVTNTFPEREEAVMVHASQHPNPDLARQRLREGMTAAGRAAGLPDGHWAETFRVIQIAH
ncbi:MAG: PIG-L family deacetylase [Micrococcales bacterium]|nr:PIG-L family deacetylase [Micrococcales bacterium]